ncbi:TRAP transporter substrate-binding protein [Salinarimonas soli]|uniref:ABC transporter substrate-binding protein n=1 Tax=Salinarimonas soli TaxID=1638099 RepID=A0A5B2V7T1_9HYPH|nr:TRAP transporter substrate-binding protein [Salinarimonas soli]KAA2234359.1 ABC transporter substrate-binding protein [Salinarimonas soli]
MKRRHFLASAAVGAAASAVAAPAIAQSAPEIRWRLQSAFPKSLDTLYGGADLFCRVLADLTDGRFQLQPFAAGEIVGTFQVADAVSNGVVEVGQATTYYYVGKDPTFALPCDVPFGLNARQKNAWMTHGGGLDLCNEFFAKQKMYALPAGNTGAQMGGWFRKEVKTLEDLKGLKFRIGGLGGQVMQKLGAVPQQIAGGDIYPALERGTIDAAEFVGPYDDEKLGFNKVAPFYYYPGWWDGGPLVHVMFNLDKWNELPKAYKAAVHAAAAQVNIDMLGKYDARNPAALRRLVGGGAQLRPFSQEIMEAAYKASNEVYDEISAKNPDFKKVYEALRAFRGEEYLWFQVAEYSFDSFMIRSRGR